MKLSNCKYCNSGANRPIINQATSLPKACIHCQGRPWKDFEGCFKYIKGGARIYFKGQSVSSSKTKQAAYARYGYGVAKYIDVVNKSSIFDTNQDGVIPAHRDEDPDWVVAGYVSNNLLINLISKYRD